MSRDDDSIINAWILGNIWIYGHGLTPHYTSSDADAITLLPELVKKGFYPALYYSVGGGNNAGWRFEISTKTVPAVAPTIHEAITSAILKIIADVS